MTRLLNRRHAEHPLTSTHITHMSQTNERPVDASQKHMPKHTRRLCVHRTDTHTHLLLSTSNVCGRENRMQWQSIGRQSQRQGTRGRWTRGDHRPNHTQHLLRPYALMTSHFRRPRDDGQGVECIERQDEEREVDRRRDTHTIISGRQPIFLPLLLFQAQEKLRSSGLARIRILCPMVRHSSFFM